jgi:hypothetical protein
MIDPVADAIPDYLLALSTSSGKVILSRALAVDDGFIDLNDPVSKRPTFSKEHACRFA